MGCGAVKALWARVGNRGPGSTRLTQRVGAWGSACYQWAGVGTRGVWFAALGSELEGHGAVCGRATEADARDKLSTRLPHLHDLKWHAFWFGVRGWGHGAVSRIEADASEKTRVHHTFLISCYTTSLLICGWRLVVGSVVVLTSTDPTDGGFSVEFTSTDPTDCGFSVELFEHGTGSGAVYSRTEADASDKMNTRSPHFHDLRPHSDKPSGWGLGVGGTGAVVVHIG
eukprot:2818623-Rhodomonas_salina.1